jgi:hypothetical protein
MQRLPRPDFQTADFARRNLRQLRQGGSPPFDLPTIAPARTSTETFARRLETIRERHARKDRVIERLAKPG